MPNNNIVILYGTLAADPLLNTLPNGTPYLQLFLVVERSASQMSRDAKAKDAQQIDVLRVVRYGAQAHADFFYLQKGAAIVVIGWGQSRAYVERRGGREARRVQLEVNAQTIVYGRNCNFERGDRRQADREKQFGPPPFEGRPDPVSPIAEQLLKVLAAETD